MIKEFVEKHPFIKVNLNFHAYGNLWIVPYNYYDKASNPDLNTNLTAS